MCPSSGPIEEVSDSTEGGYTNLRMMLEGVPLDENFRSSIEVTNAGKKFL